MATPRDEYIVEDEDKAPSGAPAREAQFCGGRYGAASQAQCLSALFVGDVLFWHPFLLLGKVLEFPFQEPPTILSSMRSVPGIRGRQVTSGLAS